MQDTITQIAQRFQIIGKAIAAEPTGCGHINRTYYVRTDTENEYLLQRVNTHIFPDIDGLMNNISLVTEHVRSKIAAAGGDPDRQSMTIIPTHDGKNYLRLPDGCWRCYIFIGRTETLQSPRTQEDFYLSAKAFGTFQHQLADFPAETLCEPIANFHNTPKRLQDLFDAEQADILGRVREVQPELAFIHARTEFAGILQRAIVSGELPLKVTHNDTKLNNLLFDAETMLPLAVVDLDTVMPGSSLYDFGDSIRFGTATAAEDEKDTDKMSCDLEMFDAFVRGWIESCGSSMNQLEKDYLYLAGRILTLECGVRFLTDYLQGDTYFATSRPGQNLDRCRTQLKLVADMEQKEAEMKAIVEKYL